MEQRIQMLEEKERQLAALQHSLTRFMEELNVGDLPGEECELPGCERLHQVARNLRAMQESRPEHSASLASSTVLLQSFLADYERAWRELKSRGWIPDSGSESAAA